MPDELTRTIVDGSVSEYTGGSDLIENVALDAQEPIAVVGVGLRFPGGARSLAEFGEFLSYGRSGIGPIPQDRWDVAAFTPSSPDERGKIRTTGGGFLDRIDLFDPGFFNISPKEAQYMDPQQRMLLETAWHALEHANIDPAPLRRGNGGVYIGASSIDYALELDALPYSDLDGLLASGITMFPLSGRLSYFLGWRGPSMSIDTACSSSLTALHMAVQGLRNRECDIALCGGVNALHHPRIPVMFSHAQMLAPDGLCKTFDEAADGYVRAEGCGVIVLKRLSSAQQDGDTILAVVRGTAVGQDGDSAGLTVPNGTAQEIVMRRAISAAGLTPADIQYVEAHGTGTPLGDPIELGAINDVFADSHTADDPLIVGSVKTNLGHMEPASGLVGLIKVVSQLQTGAIYPHLNLTTPSGRIPWSMYPITVPLERRDWHAPVRRAVVNSFGFAGTIAAVVLEQAPRVAAAPPPRHARPIFTISAKTEAALAEQVARYRQLAVENPDVELDRLCYTTNVGRSHFKHRLAAPVDTVADLVKVLDRKVTRTDQASTPAFRKIGFLFSGQGSQYAGMGGEFYRQYPVFARWVDECDGLFAPLLGVSVRQLLCDAADETGLIDQTMYTQAALFTFEYALAQLWMSWGAQPSVLIGHSIGEVTAAAVAGLFSLPDAVTLVASRGRLMQSVSRAGGMAAVSATTEQVLPLIHDYPDLAIAAVNAPDQCVLSGASDTLAKVCAALREQDVRVEELTVSHAFHSPLMREVYDDFRAAITGIAFREPTITLISNVTGAVAKRSELADPEYWVEHIGRTVRFMDGLRAAARRGRHAFIEIGPSTALTAVAKRCVDPADHSWYASLRRRDTGGDTIARSLTELYLAGLAVSWAGVHSGRELATLTLPNYPFQGKRYWLPIKSVGKARVDGPSAHPLLGSPAAGEVTGADVLTFVTRVSAADPAYLADHVIGDQAQLPASAYLEAMLAAQDAVWGSTGRVVRNLVLGEPLTLTPDAEVELHTQLTLDGDGGAEVRIASVAGGSQVEHARATLHRQPALLAPDDSLWKLLYDTPVSGEAVSAEDLYVDLASVDRRYGPRFTLLEQVRCHPGGVLTASVACRPATAVEHMPVEVLECALLAAVAGDQDAVALRPARVDSIQVFKKPRGTHLRLIARTAPEPSTGEDDRIADMVLLEGDTPIAELRGVRLSRIGEDAQRRNFVHELTWLPVTATRPPMPRSRHAVVVHADQRHVRQAQAQQTEALSVTVAEDLAALEAALSDPTVTDVCWYWQPTFGPPSADRLRTECERNYRDLLATIALLDASPPSRALRLWLVTEGAQLLPQDEAGDGTRLAASTLWGFGRVLANEAPRYRVSLVDLPPEEGCPNLLEELQAGSADEFQIAYRDGQRYVRRLAPVRSSADQAPDQLKVLPDRNYVITGGLGGLGLVTARKLVELGARHVTLVSRRSTPTPEAASVLEELRTRARIRIIPADLSSADDVRRLFAALAEDPQPVGGIVHAAGEIGKSLIASLSWETIDQQLRPKVYGGWLLHEASLDLPELDFFIVYSSIAGVIGGMTQAHYAGASTFMDALAGWRQRSGRPGLALNWGAWASVGMSARLDEALSRQVERGGIRFFSPTRGLRALARLAARPDAQRIIGEYDWDLIAAANPNADALYTDVARPVQPGVAGVDIAELLLKPESQRVSEVGGLVRAMVAQSLEFDDPEAVDVDAELVSLGLDSLMAMEVRRSLESSFGLALPASLAYDYPSVSKLTAFVNGQITAATAS